MIIKTSHELIEVLRQYPDVKVLVHAQRFPNIRFDTWSDEPFISIVGDRHNEGKYLEKKAEEEWDKKNE